MRFPFESEEAQQLNRDIFETIYYAALKASCELAKVRGPYETYPGSPVSKGVSTHRVDVIGKGSIVAVLFEFNQDSSIRHVERHTVEAMELGGTP